MFFSLADTLHSPSAKMCIRITCVSEGYSKETNFLLDPAQWVMEFPNYVVVVFPLNSLANSYSGLWNCHG